jgi:hypothetical protein
MHTDVLVVHKLRLNTPFPCDAHMARLAIEDCCRTEPRRGEFVGRGLDKIGLSRNDGGVVSELINEIPGVDSGVTT